MAKNYIKEYLSDDDLTAITNHIAEIEKFTSGEIRICFRLNKSFMEKKLSAKEIAVKEFHKLGMHKTEDKTGVLLYIIFEERSFEIVADEGINSKIDESKWNIITNHLITEFKNNSFKLGIIKCLDEIKNVLHTEFPINPDDKNELPNDIIIK